MRKHAVVTIEAEGRDKGKTFLVLEKSAYEAEKWATRALLALSRNGVEVPEEAMNAGALGILIAGLAGFKQMRFDDAEPLLDEMLTCISFVPDVSKLDPVNGRPLARPLITGDDGDIDEVTTLLKLRGEALELHLGFSVNAVLSSLAAAVPNSSQPASSTSRKHAAPRSRAARPRSTKSRPATA